MKQVMSNDYPSISYAIPVCNEHVELEHLLNQLNDFVDTHDQIVIQKDTDNVTDEVIRVIELFSSTCKCEIHIIQYPLRNDFSSFKNNLKAHCTKDYIFQIDADEYLGDGLLMNLPNLLASNSDTDLFFIPRINIVKGLTLEYAESQHWNLRRIDFPISKEFNEYVVNYPDRQARLFRNKIDIKWRNKVHEVIVGHKSYIDMASGMHELDPEQVQAWCLIHIKDLARQQLQNEKYSKIIKSSYE